MQNVEQNHPFFEPFCTSLATLRLYLFVHGDDIAIPFAVLKLPCGQNLADNFWREGNLACAVDPQTGIVQTVRRAENGAICTYEDHPDNIAPLVGEAIPMWGELLTMARSCAKLFQPIGYQSMDIAVTAHGPKLVEINTGGAFDLPQIATGRGFLTDEVVKHLHDRGFDKI